MKTLYFISTPKEILKIFKKILFNVYWYLYHVKCLKVNPKAMKVLVINKWEKSKIQVYFFLKSKIESNFIKV